MITIYFVEYVTEILLDKSRFCIYSQLISCVDVIDKDIEFLVKKLELNSYPS